MGVCVSIFVSQRQAWAVEDVRLQVALVPVTPPLPALTLGPVIGRVTATRAIVLAEVDSAASVQCILTDVISGRK
jgi:hypothetical protein